MQLQMIWEPPGSDGTTERSRLREYSRELPQGYRLRTFRDGDRSGYLSLMRRGGFPSWRSATLDAALKAALPDGVFFVELEPSGELVSTAVAQHNSIDLHPFGGELGWVSTVPAHRGNRLSRVVCSAVVLRFLKAGYSDIFLRTDDWRLPAIKTYLNIGFRPFLFLPEMEGRWKNVCERLGVEWEGVRPDPDKPNLDSIERYTKRRVWLPDREHRGFSGPGDVDAFGDEWLYSTSDLGSAAVEPSSVTAGTKAALRVTYSAGRAGLSEGGEIHFVVRGQTPLGARLFEPEHTAVRGPAGCVFSCIPGKGVRMDVGTLREGDRVTVDVEKFEWTVVAGRREMKVVLSCPGMPERRLPAPLVVDVRPGPCSRYEVLVPPARCGETDAGDVMPISVTARDRYDNRVSSGEADGILRALAGDHAADVRVVRGRGRTLLPTAGAHVVRAAVFAEAEADADADACADAAARRSSGPSASSRIVGRSNPSVRSVGECMFIGDLHCHDYLSEAEGYPDQVYAWAREEKRLDFVSVVPQSHGRHDNQTWTITKYMNERHLDEGSFVTFLGFEWQHSAFGDKVVHFLGGDQPYLPVDLDAYNRPDKLYAALRNSDAFIISHHPAYPRDVWVPGTDYGALDLDLERLIEIWSMHGSSEGYSDQDTRVRRYDESNSVTAALKRGLRIGFTAGSDTHRGRPGGAVQEPGGKGRRIDDESGRPLGGLTAVWASDLTRTAIFDALRARRTCALTGARIIVRFFVNDASMGSEIEPSETAVLRGEIWAEDAIETVDIVKNGALLRRIEPTDETCRFEVHDETGGTAFYYCRVLQRDGHRAVCSPVWVG